MVDIYIYIRIHYYTVTAYTVKAIYSIYVL